MSRGVGGQVRGQVWGPLGQSDMSWDSGRAVVTGKGWEVITEDEGTQGSVHPQVCSVAL